MARPPSSSLLRLVNSGAGFRQIKKEGQLDPPKYYIFNRNMINNI
jgi:hypothetical protein